MLVLVCAIVTLVWFRLPFVMGGGDIGLPFYRIGRIWSIEQHLWWDAIGTGWQFAQGGSSLFFYWGLNAMSSVGVPDYVLQASVYFGVLAASCVFFFRLSNSLNRQGHSSLAAFVGAIFYAFNTYSMLTVWHRFIQSLIFMLALLPLTLYLSFRGIESRSLRYPVFASLSFFLFSYVFGSPSQILTLSVPLAIVPLTKIVFDGINKDSIKSILRFFVVMLPLSILLNMFWILSYLQLSVTPSPQLAIQRGSDLATFDAISKLTPMIDVLRLLNFSYLVDGTTWGRYYLSQLSLFVQFLTIIVTASGLIAARRNKGFFFFASLFVIGLFLAKGGADPLGFLLRSLVASSPIFGVLRNPYEKLGLVFVLGYSYFFGIGLASITARVMKLRFNICPQVRSSEQSVIKPVRVVLLTAALCALLLGLQSWPMWTGQVFSSPYVNSYYVQPPVDYGNLREYLGADHSVHRVLVLPFVPGFGITYEWPQGYSGIEPSELLFDSSVISRLTGVEQTDAVLASIPKEIVQSDAWKLLSILNVRYIVVSNYTRPGLLGTTDRILSPEAYHSALLERRVPSPFNSTEGVASIPIEPANFVALWGANQSATAEISPSSSTSSLIVSGESAGGSFGFYIELPTDIGGDWTAYKYLSFEIQSNTPATLLVSAQDASGSGPNWDGRTDTSYRIVSNETNTTLRFNLPLEFPSQAGSMKGISKTLFALLGINPDEPVHLRLSHMRLDKGTPLPVENIRFVKRFGKLSLFELAPSVFLDRIYAATQYLVLRDTESILRYINTGNFVPGTSVLISSADVNQLNSATLMNLSAVLSPPQLWFEKKSPANYRVHVISNSPFFLVFSETYHPGWKASFEDLREQISEANHFVAFGYGNAWLVSRTGDFWIDILYQPQSALDAGLILSSVGVVLALIMLARPHLDRPFRTIRRVRVRSRRTNLFRLTTQLRFHGYRLLGPEEHRPDLYQRHFGRDDCHV